MCRTTTNNCLFYDNKFSTNISAGGLVYDGDVAVKTSTSSLIVDNCTFISNSLGKVPIYTNSPTSNNCPVSIKVRNTILNSISGQRAIHFTTNSCGSAYTATISNSIYTTGSAVTGVNETSCSTATDAGFYFTDRDNKVYSITASSPCVNAGTTWVGPPANPTVPESKESV